MLLQRGDGCRGVRKPLWDLSASNLAEMESGRDTTPGLAFHQAGLEGSCSSVSLSGCPQCGLPNIRSEPELADFVLRVLFLQCPFVDSCMVLKADDAQRSCAVLSALGSDHC